MTDKDNKEAVKRLSKKGGGYYGRDGKVSYIAPTPKSGAELRDVSAFTRWFRRGK